MNLHLIPIIYTREFWMYILARVPGHRLRERRIENSLYGSFFQFDWMKMEVNEDENI